MHVREELVVGLLAFIVAFVCWILASVDEGKSHSRELSRRSDSYQGLKDVEDGL